MYKIVLLRHGESAWDKENRFAGWADIDLGGQGEDDARAAGRLLRRHGHAFDVAHTSVLRRANRTLNLALDELDSLWLPVEHTWRLNERSWGVLQGMDEAAAISQFGTEQVVAWRRSFDAAPPPLEDGDERLTLRDPRYTSLPRAQFPRTESLKDVGARVAPYWETILVPQILAGRRLLVVAHDGSLRALVAYMSGIGGEDVASIDIPPAQPVVCELDANLRPVRSYGLSDDEGTSADRSLVAGQDWIRG